MSNSVKFDNTEINASPYYPRFVKHESFPERDVGLLKPSREDGDIFVYTRFGKKIIKLTGFLSGTSQANFESNKDTMAELFSREEKNLDLDWNGTTRRYVATCSRFEMDRDHYNISNCPWTAEFVVSAGVGKDTTITAEKHAQAVNANPYSWTSTFAGSASPKPVITLEIGAGFTTPKGIAIENVTTGEKIVFNKPTALASGDTIAIDFENKKVTLEGVEQRFYGSFPSLIIGENSLKLYIADILDQFADVYGGGLTVWGDLQSAMSIMVSYTDPTYRRVDLYIEKDGTPTDLIIEIQTDVDGAPSGVLVDANAYVQVAYADIPDIPAWITDYLVADIELEANTKYWIVVRANAAGGSPGDLYGVGYATGSAAVYPRGNVARSVDDGATWTDYPNYNLAVKLYYGGKKDAALGTITLDVDYYKRYL